MGFVCDWSFGVVCLRRVSRMIGQAAPEHLPPPHPRGHRGARPQHRQGALPLRRRPAVGHRLRAAYTQRQGTQGLPLPLLVCVGMLNGGINYYDGGVVGGGRRALLPLLKVILISASGRLLVLLSMKHIIIATYIHKRVNTRDHYFLLAVGVAWHRAGWFLILHLVFRVARSVSGLIRICNRIFQLVV